MCYWFSSKNKTAGLYLNGNSIASFGYDGAIVSGGGDLIFGQDQDTPNTGALDQYQVIV